MTLLLRGSIAFLEERVYPLHTDGGPDRKSKMAVHHITRWRPVRELLGPTSAQSPHQFTDVTDHKMRENIINFPLFFSVAIN